MNTFNSDNSNIANIKIQHQEIMTTITNRILKIKPVIKISIVTNHTFFAIITFSYISSFT